MKFDVETLAKIFTLPSVVAGIATSGIIILMKRHYSNLDNAKKLHKMIIMNNYYDKNYFPEVYYQEDAEKIGIKIKLDGSKYHDKFLELGAKFEQIYNCEISSNNISNGFITYSLAKSNINNRLNINDIVIRKDEYKIPLMKNLEYDLVETCHILVTGGVGGGKTYFVFYIIKCLLEMGCELKIIDPKMSDLSNLDSIIGENNVAYKTENIFEILENAVAEMDRRYELMRQSNDSKLGRIFSDYGLKPYFVIFDEFVAFNESLESKEAKKVRSYMSNIILKGRQSGVFLALATQRPDADAVGGAIRDNLGMRIALGNMSKNGYRMVFGDVNKTYLERTIRGQGYIYLNGKSNNVMEFYSPFIEKDYDFSKEIKKIWEKRNLIDLEKNRC